MPAAEPRRQRCCQLLQCHTALSFCPVGDEFRGVPLLTKEQHARPAPHHLQSDWRLDGGRSAALEEPQLAGVTYIDLNALHELALEDLAYLMASGAGEAEGTWLAEG